MGLLEEVAAEPRKKGAVEACIAARLIATMPSEDRDDLTAALGNAEYTTAAILRVLNRRGIDVRRAALSRHRNRECPCYGPRG